MGRKRRVADRLPQTRRRTGPIVQHTSFLGLNRGRCCYEAVGLGFKRDRAGLVRRGSHDGQAQAVEGVALFGLERLEACRVAIVGGDDAHETREGDAVVYLMSISVDAGVRRSWHSERS
jgi:hypothetical protein